MIPIFLRAFSTVFTVVVAVAVTAQLGDTSAGKLVSVAIIATTIGLVEWLLIWLPRHSELARRLLDRRSIMTGVWVQDVRDVQPLGVSDEEHNRFGIFSVEYRQPGGYSVNGTAYDSTGSERARWSSVETPTFAEDGRSMTYLFEGTIVGRAPLVANPERTGLHKLTLTSDDAGTGKVERIASERVLLVNLHRVTTSWLAKRGLDLTEPDDLRDPGSRDEFARAFAATLPQSRPTSAN
jgi:hypothetical protein